MSVSAWRVVVGSRNPVKLQAAQRGFERFFPGHAVAVEGVEVPSGVAEQPVGDAETRRGARQRALRAREAVPEAAFWVGLEGGVAWEGDDLFSFAWIAVLGADGRWGLARSGTFLLPPAVAALIREGLELGVADDRVFGAYDSKRKMGAVGLLTDGAIDRAALYEHALLLALIPFGSAWRRAGAYQV